MWGVSFLGRPTMFFDLEGAEAMKRMRFVCLFAMWVLFSFDAAEAQKSPAVRKIGFLSWSVISHSGTNEMFRRSLGEPGYAEGRNLAIEYRTAEGRPQLLDLANALVRDKVEVIVAGGGPAARSAKDATKTIPIVFATSGDPVESGFVDSIAGPGGTMTGISWLSFELVGKRLELLKEAAPGVSRVAILSTPSIRENNGSCGNAKQRASHGNNPRISSSKNTRRIRRRLRCPKQAKRKTAKQIGLTIPPNLLTRADKVIR
jgi:ABC-type uncharacterized transport system substrate-binding protein